MLVRVERGVHRIQLQRRRLQRQRGMFLRLPVRGAARAPATPAAPAEQETPVQRVPSALAIASGPTQLKKWVKRTIGNDFSKPNP